MSLSDVYTHTRMTPERALRKTGKTEGEAREGVRGLTSDKNLSEALLPQGKS